MRFRLRIAFAVAAGASLALVAQLSASDDEPPNAGPQHITSADLDTLVATQPGASGQSPAVSDEAFLRRVSFDLIGRQPTLHEQRQFALAPAPQKYADTVERLLAGEEFGANWANYWCDTIAYRVPPPELTYLNYAPLKKWLTDKLNQNAPWDEVVRALITATGKIADVPAATFVGYHAADPTNLAGETSRIFLGQQIGCAQCHDHPFDRWKRSQFHELAAFFARTKSKLPHNDGEATVVSAAPKGEYLMPNMQDPLKKGSQMRPGFLDGQTLKKGQSDERRRAELADWVTAKDNPWFARALVNRVWSRTMGRGFYEPVDDLGDSQRPLWSAVHEALARHFTATNYDVKDLLRLVATSESYRRGLRTTDETAPGSVAAALLRLRGDEVFSALAVGIELPNVTPPKVAPTPEVRFPPPPRSTRDLVNEAFGTDPSLSPADAPRTMSQALWMMNNQQLQRQINAAPASGTMLAKLLSEQTDDAGACRALYSRLLARGPTDAEMRVALDHVKSLDNRGTAFEDLLWSLVNSAEFTSRR